MITNEDRIEYEAGKMLHTFFMNLIPDTNKLAPGGLEEMKERFAKVPAPFRGEVYLRFKEKLSDRNIEFDNGVAA